MYTHTHMYVYTHTGLIDFGQVKRLTHEQRLQLCKLIIALDNHDHGTHPSYFTQSLSPKP
jgi:predicted unusual protein kinase regulating ubiquinone biosynthesis (AarF/ABC1/UbiB family)